MMHLLVCLLLAAALLTGCGGGGGTAAASPAAYSAEEGSSGAADSAAISIGEEQVALAAAPAVPTALTPVASGTLCVKNDRAAVDYSHTEDGYVMARYTASTRKKLKAQVTGPSAVTYTYDLTPGQAWTTFPLSDGSGSYGVVLYENISGTRYAAVLSAKFTAALTDEFLPFLYPNQYVDYTPAVNTVKKAAELTAGKTDTLDRVKAIYDFTVTNLTYDTKKAASVKSGYLPVLDTVLAQKKGICFDYAALMAGMLRSQGVPCKLVVGYAGTAYHAWINVWSAETGWMNAAIYFDGTNWKLMDPTFASSAGQSAGIMKYIGDGSHYTAKYIY